MNEEILRVLLEQINSGLLSVETGINQIKEMYYSDLDFAKVDIQRQDRCGFSEVIYCQGKTTAQVVAIARKLNEHSRGNILATRANHEVYLAVCAEISTAEYNELAQTIVIKKGPQKSTGHILVISAGTSDIPVAEEAAVTAETMGNDVTRVYDTGVAGLHRLLAQTDKLNSARVIIAVAGMEGALPSVIGGLVNKPVIAVPTSVGYGANFGGLSALLTMLNSCSAGIGVVNIDNGFGAGFLASLINHPQC
ncbi:1-(5-phosphoribosyl)-5-amino-4-imidazole- carboxylate (AIR) carboxylase [Syntrophobotulus glycolicus DSM 8271]|uniref:1-(5-phosphoribosyl)-5-amino-4-imidazole-carboxylate (AIR) carboxylase n=1 Tax=Syntrophobotulus glycolicus (strain DSM 8271 / FlGlyR) TaxID=645991 RepID=F0SZJ1_SYNGF|nr:nickel pincer cofactor biosynthesis protein LarB [Syntrophobotulus glycolicus]ADY56077.1 1-(5-phosphoribosyl)-5-amino-4-imidazole- carboxylate (AIR) carboxylase [Syntrophobotulus glycolicus DSM 8271]